MSAYTDADVQAASDVLHTNWGTDPKAPPADCDWAARIVLDAVVPAIVASAKAEAWDEGFATCSEWWHACAAGDSVRVDATNPYRADEIERATP